MRMAPAAHLSSMPSPGALLGTSGGSELIQSINDSIGNTEWFESARNAFAPMHNAFLQNVVNPIRQTMTALSSTVTSYLNPDVFRPLVQENDLVSIPPCMHIPILMAPAVQHLHEQGRIDGFGYDPDTLPYEDVHGRLLQNGHIENALSEPPSDNPNYHPMVYIWDSNDPQLDDEEIEAIRDTREFIETYIRETGIDPTAYSNPIA